MKMKIFTLVAVMFFAVQIFPQNYLQQTLNTSKNPEELVTLSSDITFNQAIQVLSKVSLKITGRPIISSVSVDSSIGITLRNMNYQQALVVLVKMAGLIYTEKPDAIVISKPANDEKQRTAENYVSPDTREVQISAVFFEEDVNKARNEGINWQTAFAKAGLNVGGSVIGFAPNANTSGATGANSSSSSTTTTSSTGVSPDFNLNLSSNINAGGMFGKATAIFQFFENQNLGDIIASPNVTVLDGEKANLQDGQDIAIKEKDFSGNTIDKFYSTGTIVDVTPHVIKEDGLTYILLNIHAERSSFVPDPNNTIINKTAADTYVDLLNGEETVIGGMFINQVTKVRTGIPFLKDLPWWFFGLRYIFGSDQNSIIKKELVILIRAELVPTLKERLAGPQPTTPLKDELNKQRDRIKSYQLNDSQNNNDN
jgi:general secretion pathway protein D